MTQFSAPTISSTTEGTPSDLSSNFQAAESTPMVAPVNKKFSQVFLTGTYKIISEEHPTIVFDLSGGDNKSVLGFPEHGGGNQQWIFSPLGAGYSIQSVYNGHYLTIENLNPAEPIKVVASKFPMSWALEPDGFEEDVWRICFPNTQYLFEGAPDGSGHILLSDRHPFKRTHLWRITQIQSSAEPESIKMVARKVPGAADDTPVNTTTETIIDAEGLKLGGDGELAITTTTTTTTVTVTRVRKLEVST
ncbi:hypothetical protein BDQ12DRAFT_723412 [Crucibulum laeve]|uniref:Ricin B lectin domain-containing protein n=1 Tax=Crucibulum laeve TaxID=68775 RepID=A0A5C3MBR8_9AGAR|nr:hypothetical protein BDQ12DRAFT_723412 [Crucibulum laeve]